jgi:hypothetical protein
MLKVRCFARFTPLVFSGEIDVSKDKRLSPSLHPL